MYVPPSGLPRSVHQTGASEDCILGGSGKHNAGLRIQVLQPQKRGAEGPVQGSFILLAVGLNRHAETLAPLLHSVTDAQQVLATLRRQQPACVSVVNVRSLVVETPSEHGLAPSR